MIERLIELAKDKRPEARRALSLGIIDLCHEPNSRMDPAEKAMAGQIVIRLMQEFELELRAHMAEKLAASRTAPKELILVLAMDDVIVAKPVIEQSPLLDDSDLISIIQSKSREHRLLIAARPGIHTQVTDALLRPGEPEVLAALLNNQTAEISRAAMEYAIEESRSRMNLHGPLVTRNDLPADLALKMVSFVSDALKHEILGKFPNERELVSHLLSEAKLSPSVVTSGSTPGLGVKAAALIQRLQKNGELNITRIISFLRERRLPLFFAGLAALTKFDERNLVHFAFESEAQGLAVICRAAGADRGQFVSTVLLLEQARSGRPMPAAELQAICRLFDSLSEARAHEVMADWRVRLHEPARASQVA